MLHPRSEPLLRFITDHLDREGLALQGKEIQYRLLTAGLSSCVLQNWRKGSNPRIETFLTVLDILGYKIEIVPK